MARVGLVICNYNKEQDVIDCIQAVLENKFQDIHIYVVDNASTDGSVQKIIDHYQQVENLTLITNSENLGGSGGFNTGLREAFAAGHEFLMCVDNDALLDEDCIGELVKFMEKDQETGIAAAKIYHTQQPDIVQQYGSLIDWKNYSVDSIYLNHPESEEMPEVVYSDAVPACALMIRREVVEKIGVMPEENFLYWDDTEWCVRCTMAGYRIASVGAAKALHAMGARKEDINTFPTYYAWRNWIKFFAEHTPAVFVDDMVEVFLSSIFEICYSCMYRDEPNKATTVMAAMDDALHKVSGKAGPKRIFDMEHTYQGFEKAIQGKKEVTIVAGEYPLFGEELADRVLQKQPQTTAMVISKEEAQETELPVNTKDHAVIVLCPSIFQVEDLSLQRYYMDLDENVLLNEDNLMNVINYPMSRQNFLFAHKPLFLRLVEEY